MAVEVTVEVNVGRGCEVRALRTVGQDPILPGVRHWVTIKGTKPLLLAGSAAQAFAADSLPRGEVQRPGVLHQARPASS